MHMLQDWQTKRVAIEEETREQAATGIWRYYRTKIITASHFGHICKMRQSTSYASRVKSIYLNISTRNKYRIDELRDRI